MTDEQIAELERDEDTAILAEHLRKAERRLREAEAERERILNDFAKEEVKLRKKLRALEEAAPEVLQDSTVNYLCSSST